MNKIEQQIEQLTFRSKESYDKEFRVGILTVTLACLVLNAIFWGAIFTLDKASFIKFLTAIKSYTINLSDGFSILLYVAFNVSVCAICFFTIWIGTIKAKRDSEKELYDLQRLKQLHSLSEAYPSIKLKLQDHYKAIGSNIKIISVTDYDNLNINQLYEAHLVELERKKFLSVLS